MLRLVIFPAQFVADIKDHAKSPGFLTYVAGSGVWLLIIVSTQSVLILATQLTGHLPFANDLLLFFALAMFLCGCMLYIIIIITLIVYRMSFFEMRAEEFAPAYWINMGAVAISTLAGSNLILNGNNWSFIQKILPFLKGFTLFFWAIGSWWIPLIVILGILMKIKVRNVPEKGILRLCKKLPAMISTPAHNPARTDALIHLSFTILFCCSITFRLVSF